MKPFARFFLSAALMISIGLHWNALQVVAWAGMLRDYTAQKGWVAGVIETFDGEHPCCMCRQISRGKSQQQDESAPVSASDPFAKTPGWFCHADPRSEPSNPWRFSLETERFPGMDLLATQWLAAPPKPPPRRLTS
jgi:hypothetical protein